MIKEPVGENGEVQKTPTDTAGIKASLAYPLLFSSLKNVPSVSNAIYKYSGLPSGESEYTIDRHIAEEIGDIDPTADDYEKQYRLATALDITPEQSKRIINGNFSEDSLIAIAKRYSSVYSNKKMLGKAPNSIYEMLLSSGETSSDVDKWLKFALKPPTLEISDIPVGTKTGTDSANLPFKEVPRTNPPTEEEAAAIKEQQLNTLVYVPSEKGDIGGGRWMRYKEARQSLMTGEQADRVWKQVSDEGLSDIPGFAALQVGGKVLMDALLQTQRFGQQVLVGVNPETNKDWTTDELIEVFSNTDVSKRGIISPEAQTFLWQVASDPLTYFGFEGSVANVMSDTVKLAKSGVISMSKEDISKAIQIMRARGIETQKSLAKHMVVGDVTSKKLLQGGVEADGELYKAIDQLKKYMSEGRVNSPQAGKLAAGIKTNIQNRPVEEQAEIFKKLGWGEPKQVIDGIPVESRRVEDLAKGTENEISTVNEEGVSKGLTKDFPVKKGVIGKDILTEEELAQYAKEYPELFKDLPVKNDKITGKPTNEVLYPTRSDVAEYAKKHPKLIETTPTIAPNASEMPIKGVKQAEPGITPTEQGLIEEAKIPKELEYLKKDLIKSPKINTKYFRSYPHAIQVLEFRGVDNLGGLLQKGEGNIEKIISEIKDKGIIPIWVRGNEVLDGNHRVIALQRMGYKKIPAIDISNEWVEGERVIGRPLSKIDKERIKALDIFNKAHAGETKPPIKQVGGETLGDIIPPPTKPPAPPTGNPIEDSINGINQLLERVAAIRPEVRARYDKLVAQKFAKIRDINTNYTGKEAVEKELQAMGGGMAKNRELREGLNINEDALYDAIQNSKRLLEAEKFNTKVALRNLLESGTLPQPAQQRMLEEVFGSKIIKGMIKNKGVISDLMFDIYNLTRATLTGFLPDMGAVGIQNAVFTVSKPGITVRNILKTMVEGRESTLRAWYASVYDDTKYFLKSKESGLKLTDPFRTAGGALAKEEAAQGLNLLERIPIIGEAPKLANRWYHGFVNKMRWDIWKKEVDALEVAGFTIEKNPEMFKGIADGINLLTSRINLTKSPGANKAMSMILFSPRNTISKLQVFNPQMWRNANPIARKFMVANLSKFVLGTAGTVGAIGLYLEATNQGKIELNPTSSDFGKIVIGDRRWDLWGGYQPIIRTFFQVLLNSRKSVTSGSQGTPYLGRAGTIGRFIKNKLHPVFGLVVDWGLGNKRREDDSWISEIAPLTVMDIYEGMQSSGWFGAVTSGVPSFFGKGVQEYGNPTPTNPLSSLAEEWVNLSKDERREKISTMTSGEKKLLLQKLKETKNVR